MPFRNPFALGILEKRLHGLTDSTHTPMIRFVGNAPDVRNLASFTVWLSCKTIPLLAIYYRRWPSNSLSTRNCPHVTSPSFGRVDGQGATFQSSSTSNQTGLSTRSCGKSSAGCPTLAAFLFLRLGPDSTTPALLECRFSIVYSRVPQVSLLRPGIRDAPLRNQISPRYPLIQCRQNRSIRARQLQQMPVRRLSRRFYPRRKDRDVVPVRYEFERQRFPRLQFL